MSICQQIKDKKGIICSSVRADGVKLLKCWGPPLSCTPHISKNSKTLEKLNTDPSKNAGVNSIQAWCLEQLVQTFKKCWHDYIFQDWRRFKKNNTVWRTNNLTALTQVVLTNWNRRRKAISAVSGQTTLPSTLVVSQQVTTAGKVSCECVTLWTIRASICHQHRRLLTKCTVCWFFALFFSLLLVLDIWLNKKRNLTSGYRKLFFWTFYRLNYLNWIRSKIQLHLKIFIFWYFETVLHYVY